MNTNGATSDPAARRGQKGVFSRVRHGRPSLNPASNYRAFKDLWHSYSHQSQNIQPRVDSVQSRASSGATLMSLTPYCDATSPPRKTIVEVVLGTTDKLLESTVRMKRASTSEHVDAPDRSRPRYDNNGDASLATVTWLLNGARFFRAANSQPAASVATNPADTQFNRIGSQFDPNIAPGADLSLGEPGDRTNDSTPPGPGVLLPPDNIQPSQQGPVGSSSVPRGTPGNISWEAPRPRSLAKSIYHERHRWSNSTVTMSTPPSDVSTLRTDSNSWSESDICDSPRMTTFSHSVILKAEKGGPAIPRSVPNHPESRVPRSSPLSRRSHDQAPETIPLGQNLELARVLVTATSDCAFMPAHFMAPVRDTLRGSEEAGSWTKDPAPTTLQETGESGNPAHGDIDLEPSPPFSTNFIIRRKSSGLDLQQGMEWSCVISPQAPDASDSPESSTHFEPNIKLKSLTTENLLATGRPVSLLTTIGEGGSDIGGSSGEASPIDPCQAGSAIDGLLCPRRPTPSCASQSDMDNTGIPGSVSTREADPRTPATSVPDAAMGSDLEDEDDEDLVSETTDETNDAFFEAFEASSLDPELLPLVWSMKEQIKTHVLANIRAWIGSATDALDGSPVDNPDGGSYTIGDSSNAGFSFGNHGSSGGPSGGPGTKRPYAEDDNYDQGSGSGDGSGNGSEKRIRIEDNTPCLACPFPKRYPEMIWPLTCKKGWSSVHRLKTHLYSHHKRRLHCSRCFTAFKLEAELDSHSRSNPPCVVAENLKPPIGINRDMDKKLRSRKEIQHWTEEQRWNRMWSIIFPGDPIPSPYCPLSYIKDHEQFRKVFCRIFPGILVDEILDDLNGTYIQIGGVVVSASEFRRKLEKCVFEAMEKAWDQEVQRQSTVSLQQASRIAHSPVGDDSMHRSVAGSSQPITSSFAPSMADASLTPNDNLNENGSAGFGYSSTMDNDSSLGGTTFEEELFGLRQVQQWNEEDKGKGVDFGNGMN